MFSKCKIEEEFQVFVFIFAVFWYLYCKSPTESHALSSISRTCYEFNELDRFCWMPPA